VIWSEKSHNKKIYSIISMRGNAYKHWFLLKITKINQVVMAKK